MKAMFLINSECGTIKYGLLSLWSLISLLSVIIVTGCTSIGSTLLPIDRADYNKAVIYSDEQQLLLNLVRMRFEDRPYFVSVDSITTSKSMSLSSGASIVNAPSSSTQNYLSSNTSIFGLTHSMTTAFNSALTYGLTPSASISDTPTISYTPLQGAEFTHQMMRPLALEDVYTLLQLGWRESVLFRVVLEQLIAIEPFENEWFVTGGSPPDFRRIIELVTLLTTLRNERMIYYTYGQVSGITLSDKDINKTVSVTTTAVSPSTIPAAPISVTASSTSTALQLGRSIDPSKAEKMQTPPIPSIVMVIIKKYIHDPKIKKLYKLLGATDSPRQFYFVDQQSMRLLKGKDHILVVRKRSFMGILQFLRNAVEFTPDAVQQGLIDTIKYPNGTYYDLTRITRGLLRIHVSNSPPAGLVNVKVFYRNHWFYIADNDITSKKTFALIAQIYNLLSSANNRQRPVLTIPIGL